MILRAYNANLRPVVIVIALLSAIWSLFSMITAFETLHVDKDHGFPKLGTFAVILGAIYAGTCGIEIFGILAASMRRLGMARIYAYLSIVSALAIVGAGLMRVVVHFILKGELISECEKIVTGDIVVYQFGFWGPTYEDKLTGTAATSWCNSHWSHDSFVEIISLIIEIILTAFFSSLAFAFYHQLLDPTSIANVTRAPPAATHEDAYPAHYNPPYLSYDAPQYAPPPGPPPEDEDEDGSKLYGGSKPPMYSEDDLGTYGEDKSASKSDPFADFEGPSSRSVSRTEGRDDLV